MENMKAVLWILPISFMRLAMDLFCRVGYQADDLSFISLSSATSDVDVTNNPLGTFFAVMLTLLAWITCAVSCSCSPVPYMNYAETLRRWSAAKEEWQDAKHALIYHCKIRAAFRLFMMETHARVGSDSSMQVFKNDPLYDKRLMGAIYLFVGDRDHMPVPLQRFTISQSDTLTPRIKNQEWTLPMINRNEVTLIDIRHP